MKITTPQTGQGTWSDQVGKSVSGAAVESGRSLPARLMFSPGQLVRGQVLGMNPDGKLLLAIDGKTVEAKSEVNLKPGSSFWFEVRQNEPLWLRLAGQKGTAQNFLQQFAADSSAMGRGLRALLEMSALSGSMIPGENDALLEFAQAALDGKADSGRLLKLLSVFGQFGAAPAGDGKSSQGLEETIGKLASLLAREESPLAKSTAASLKKLGSLLALQNELNALPPSPQQGLLHLFPCLFSQDAGWGQWLFSCEKEDGGAAQGGAYSLSFFLEMSRIGEVQIQIKGLGTAVRGDFVVGDEPVREYLSHRLEELTDLLGGLGYAPVQLSCRLGRTGLLEAMKGAIEEAAGLEPVRLVDLKA